MYVIQSKVRLLYQPITIDPFREAHIEDVSMNTEAALPRVGAERPDPRDVGEDLTEINVHIRGETMQPDVARKKRHPGCQCNIKVPLIVSRGRGRCHRLRLQFHRPGGKDRS